MCQTMTVVALHTIRMAEIATGSKLTPFCNMFVCGFGQSRTEALSTFLCVCAVFASFFALTIYFGSEEAVLMQHRRKY